MRRPKKCLREHPTLPGWHPYKKLHPHPNPVTRAPLAHSISARAQTPVPFAPTRWTATSFRFSGMTKGFSLFGMLENIARRSAGGQGGFRKSGRIPTPQDRSMRNHPGSSSSRSSFSISATASSKPRPNCSRPAAGRAERARFQFLAPRRPANRFITGCISAPMEAPSSARAARYGITASSTALRLITGYTVSDSDAAGAGAAFDHRLRGVWVMGPALPESVPNHRRSASAEQPGIVQSNPTQHYRIDMLQSFLNLLNSTNSPVNLNKKIGKIGLQPVHLFRPERRDVPIFPGTEPFQYCYTGMNSKFAATGPGYR